MIPPQSQAARDNWAIIAARRTDEAGDQNGANEAQDDGASHAGSWGRPEPM